ncbi:ABC transporter ATP-binding protein [Bacteroidales bacterium]|nr:ABC transporter ATP-binding protein [Bacteroidales bacterium]
MSAIIHFEDLTKIYKMGDVEVAALKGVSASIYKGQFVSIMGHSGSGKSTLLNILGCLDNATDGEYLLNGHAVVNMPEEKLTQVRNKEIGFVFQSFNLLPKQNALNNVALPLIYANYKKEERNQMAFEALQKVGLGDRSDHLPNQMSGGQRQRVAIARALVNKPALILADEPTGNLDSSTTHEIMELFMELHNSGNTIVVVTHEDEISEYTERVIWLKDGLVDKVIEQEPKRLVHQ